MKPDEKRRAPWVIAVALVAVLVVGASLSFGNDKDERMDPTGTGAAVLREGTDIPPAPLGVTAIAKDERGREFISNQLIVEFRPGTSEGDVLSVLEKIEGKMLQGYRPESPIMLVSVADKGDGMVARRAVGLLQKDPRVLRADLNLLTTMPPRSDAE